MTALRMGGLFFGYGGLDLAVQEVLDAELVWLSEIEKGANLIAAHRFPGVPNVGDMLKVDWTELPPVDVLTGGSPCQDVSTAGQRAGMAHGTRSNLWTAMADAIAVLRPQLVVWENVGGIFSARAISSVEPCPGCVGDTSAVHLRALGRVLGDLATIGYDASWVTLQAAQVGACHLRLRVFVVAYPQSRRGQPGRDRNGPPRYPLRSRQPAGGLDPAQAVMPERLLPTPAVNDMGAGKEIEAFDDWAARQKSAAGAKAVHGPSLDVEVRRLLPTPTLTDARNTGQAGDSQLDRHSPGLNAIPKLTARDWGEFHPAIARWESLTRPAPSPLEVGEEGSPRLSARFEEWMMGLPDGWVTDVPGIRRNQALKALGNGVVPQQAAAALSWLLG